MDRGLERGRRSRSAGRSGSRRSSDPSINAKVSASPLEGPTASRNAFGVQARMASVDTSKMSTMNEAWAGLEQHVADILETPYSDFAKITDGLFVGSHPYGKIDPFDIGADVVVTLTGEPSTSGVPRGKLLIHWPIKDGPLPRMSVLRPLAKLIASCIDDGASVFVHCAAGMNRSCLVARPRPDRAGHERSRHRRAGAGSPEGVARRRVRGLAGIRLLASRGGSPRAFSGDRVRRRGEGAPVRGDLRDPRRFVT
jgi:hypothetical protein